MPRANEAPEILHREGSRGKKLAGDVAAGALSALLVAPSITIIDRAITKKVASGQRLYHSIRSGVAGLRRPSLFILSRPFGIVWSMYAATYVVANASDTLAIELYPAYAGAVTFVSTMLVNTPMGIWKDLQFAKLYGNSTTSPAAAAASSAAAAASSAASAAPGNVIKTPHTTVPVSTPKKTAGAAMSAFLIRDAITVYSSFTLAPAVTAAIPSSLASNDHAKNNIAQVTVPALSQVLATPGHLLGLDFHNRPYRISLPQRMGHIRRHLPLATVGRCLRIIPPFGLGCLANTEMRSIFHGLS